MISTSRKRDIEKFETVWNLVFLSLHPDLVVPERRYRRVFDYSRYYLHHDFLRDKSNFWLVYDGKESRIALFRFFEFVDGLVSLHMSLPVQRKFNAVFV